MTDLMAYAAALDGLAGQSLPPVDKWNPEYCGELNLTIKADGTWFHEGTPIGRARLVRLFSTVIKREGDRFYLVTPVEKLGIIVEDAPFVAVLMQAEGEGTSRRLVFTTNVGDEVVAGPDHEIVYRKTPDGSSMAPYIHVRRGLEAKIARSVFYDLVTIAENRDGVLGVCSKGSFFALGAIDEPLG